MQTVIDISRLKPLGTNILVKRVPTEERVKSVIIPECARDRNELKGQLYSGCVIAVGDRTRSARHGRDKGWYEPGDIVHFFALWDWKDHEVVLKDSETGDEYLMVNESGVKAYEIMGE